MTSIDEMLQELDQETATTRRVLERVAADKLEWRPHPRSLTLGQLAMHVATLPGAIAEIALRNDFDVGAPIPRPGARSVEELLGALDESVATARSVLAGMNDAQLATPWPMMLGDSEVGAMPRGAFLRSVLFNHWYHHRGQLTVYVRETGSLVPAIYGASADENPLDQLKTHAERGA